MGISRRFSMTLHGSYDRSLKTRRDHNRRQSAPQRGQAVQNHKLPPHIPGPLANDAGNADSERDVFRKSIKIGCTFKHTHGWNAGRKNRKTLSAPTQLTRINWSMHQRQTTMNLAIMNTDIANYRKYVLWMVPLDFSDIFITKPRTPEASRYRLWQSYICFALSSIL